MIKLELEEYCDECPNFEPEVVRMNIDGFYRAGLCNTSIFCEHRHECNGIAKYMKAKYERKDNPCMMNIPEPVRR